MRSFLNFPLYLFCFQAWAMEVPPKFNHQTSVNTGRIISNRGTFSPPISVFDLRQLNQSLLSDILQENHHLKRVKFYILNGETRMAKIHLEKIAHSQSQLRPTIKRYQGMIAFIEGRYQDSYNDLKTYELGKISYYPKICIIQTLNQVILGKKNNLENSWERCKEESLITDKTLNLYWMDTLVTMVLSPREGMSQSPFRKIKLKNLDNSELKIFLKLALYLNQELRISKELKDLTTEHLEDEDIRELAGQIYFRNGEFANAYRFIEDLQTPNAENIKGNFYLIREKYEVAYAQFKTALASKQNSQNALERLVPLAWLLGDWSQGAIYAERITTFPQTFIHKLTLIAAFHAQRGDFKKAKETLNYIVGRSGYGASLEVSQLASFVALMNNQSQDAKKFAEQSCDQLDLTNCWLLFQISQWDSFPLTLKRNGEIIDKKEWERISKTDEVQGIKESVYINQLDIEELDDLGIELIPKQTN